MPKVYTKNRNDPSYAGNGVSFTIIDVEEREALIRIHGAREDSEYPVGHRFADLYPSTFIPWIPDGCVHIEPDPPEVQWRQPR